MVIHSFRGTGQSTGLVGIQLQDGGGMRPVRRVVLAFFWVVPISLAQTDWQTLGNVSSFEKRVDGIDVLAQHGRVRVSVLSPAMIHVLYSHQDQFFDRQSFAVLPN